MIKIPTEAAMSYLNFTKQHIFNAFDELLSEIQIGRAHV